MNILVVNGSPKGKYSVTLQTVLYLEKRVTHPDAERFGFIAACNCTTVIVGKYNDRFALQVWPEDPFAGSKEVVAVS